MQLTTQSVFQRQQEMVDANDASLAEIQRDLEQIQTVGIAGLAATLATVAADLATTNIQLGQIKAKLSNIGRLNRIGR